MSSIFLQSMVHAKCSIYCLMYVAYVCGQLSVSQQPAFLIISIDVQIQQYVSSSLTLPSHKLCRALAQEVLPFVLNYILIEKFSTIFCQLIHFLIHRERACATFLNSLTLILLQISKIRQVGFMNTFQCFLAGRMTECSSVD